MLEWNIKNENEEIKKEKQWWKDNFNTWYDKSTFKEFTKRELLSKNSLMPYVYYHIYESLEKIKTKYPRREHCEKCKKSVDEWMELKVSDKSGFHLEINICKNCASNLKDVIEKWVNK